ncbi:MULTISPECIES: hypothetical protein [unclassified Mycolicibacterium]|uniref:hypothetical protein n=1 Tax=unclassified Mycolicibacterium TaxID=2636767 RepID=UPI001EE4377D|nr:MULTISPECIES: hypothetical protein [unclassified Mycolicibacterium]
MAAPPSSSWQLFSALHRPVWGFLVEGANMEKPAKAEAKTVVIDHDRGIVTIDGEPVPYYIAEGGPTTEPWGGDTLVKFECLVFAKDVQIIGKPRAKTQPAQPVIKCSSLYRGTVLQSPHLCDQPRGHAGEHGDSRVFWTDEMASA